ncbi:MAG: peptidoglycan editing factor PgeF [Cyanobacteria bacterium P01_A01_bin.3]
MNKANSNQWLWHEREGQRWLTCALLQDWPHSFSSRHSAPERPDVLAPTQLGLEGSAAHWTKQVHGDRLVWSADSSAPPTSLLEADAIASDSPGNSVWVRTADCVPVLVADGARVAAIHSGWRGTSAEIVAKTVTEMVQRGSSPATLRVAVGPAISGPVYQVSSEVAERVLATIPHLPNPKRSSITDLPSVIHEDEEPGKVRLDLRAAIAYQLLEIGIHPLNICLSPHCTWGDPDNFFSYRRLQSPPSPVQWSGIGLLHS